jgi:hypothetical protein
MLAAGLLGTAADLLLLNHVEDSWQLVPFGVIAVSLAVLLWHASRPHASSVRALRAAMALLVAAAAIGVVLHFRGNMEFQLELDPSLRGFDLVAAVMRAKAPPALAPGNMALLGLIGLASTYRHPACSSRDAGSPIIGGRS